jgi:hypothetical protein
MQLLENLLLLLLILEVLKYLLGLGLQTLLLRALAATI